MVTRRDTAKPSGVPLAWGGGGTGQRRRWFRFYPAGTPTRLRVPDVPVTALLDQAADRYGRRAALVFFGRRTTYRALARTVERFTAGLAGLGVRAGDRVALVLPNCPQFVAAYYGTLRLGAVAVPLNPRYTESELRRRLADSGAVVVVVYDGAHARVAAVRPGTLIRHVVTVSLADERPLRLRWLLRMPSARSRALRARLGPAPPRGADAVPYTRLVRSRPAPGHGAAEDVPAHWTAVLQYTGGTTGTPKGAMLSHRNLVANAHQIHSWYPELRDGRETGLAVLPFFHVYGLTLTLHVGVLAGARIVLHPDFDVEALLRSARRWKPTFLPAVPPVFDKLLDRPAEEREALGSLRSCISGAMRLPPETVDRFQAETGAELVEGYGLTEAAPVVLCNPFNANARAGTVGIPLPGTDVRIADEYDPARTLPHGTAGELAVRGPQVFQGYWRDPADTERVLRDGWLLTGDIAVMGPDGYVTVIDRKRDVIKVSGFSVYPSEVEEALLAHPEVAEAAVVAASDPEQGEAVKAWVVPRAGAVPTAAGVRAHCRRRLAAYKVPTLVEFRDEPLPRDVLGKVLRRVLREDPAR